MNPRRAASMPSIIYGTAWKAERTAALVEQAIEAGFRGIDTACQPKHYDEAGVGSGLARCLGRIVARGDLYLQTKFTPLDGHDPRRIPYDPRAPVGEQVRQSIQCSLRNLGTDYLDALLLHSPLADPAAMREAWQTMESAVASGAVLRIGISNCYRLEDLRALQADATIKPTILQNRFHAPTGYDRDLRLFCASHGIAYQSFWTLTANVRILASPLFRRLATTHGRSREQILFRYLTQIGVVPLTGTSSSEHMREDLAIFDFELGDEECTAIGALL